jgi:hypothetical protein
MAELVPYAKMLSTPVADTNAYLANFHSSDTILHVNS